MWPGHLVSMQLDWVRRMGNNPTGLGGAARKDEDSMCRDESGAGWAQAHPIRTRERTGVG